MEGGGVTAATHQAVLKKTHTHARATQKHTHHDVVVHPNPSHPNPIQVL